MKTGQTAQNATTIPWWPKQLMACKAADTHKYTLFGGSRGPGKSWWIRWYLLEYLLECRDKHINGVHVGLFCEDYVSLTDRQISKISMEFPRSMGEVRKSSTDGLGFHFHDGNGFLALRNLDDPSRYQSAEFAAIGVDELTKNPLSTFNILRGSLRWPGIDKPLFVATSNPGGIGHCVPFGEVLTPSGWRDIKEFKPGDAVFTVGSLGSLLETKVGQVYCSPYSGDMVHVSTRGLRMVCTPEHKVAKVGGVKMDQNKVFSLVPFENLPGQATILRSVNWTGMPLGRITPERYPTRTRRLNQPASLSGVDYCALLGWMLSEGCVVDRDKAISIAQSKPDVRAKLKTFLEDRCGFSVCWTTTSAIIHAADWWNHFRTIGHCREKYIDKRVKQASVEELAALLDALMDGDGCRLGTFGTYYTISKRLADNVAEIALKLGYIVYCSQRQRKNREGLSYAVSIKRVKSGGTELLTGNHLYDVQTKTKRRSDVRREHFDGNIYCLGIDNTHTFLIRQNGSVWVSGNTWVKSYWIDRQFPKELQSEADQFAFVPALPSDNPSLPKSYWEMLDTLPEPLRLAWREGRWDVFTEQAFDFNPSIHIIEPLPIPHNAQIYMTFDWGFGKPYSVGWWWVDQDGRVYRFSELYGAMPGGMDVGLRQTDEEIAERIIAHEQKVGLADRHITRICDPTCFSKKADYRGGGQGPSTAEVFARSGLSMQPGDASRALKFRQLHQRLRVVKGELPMLVAYPCCVDFIRTIQLMQVDPHDPEEIDTRLEDHCVDEACHIAMARPLGMQGSPKVKLGTLEDARL